MPHTTGVGIYMQGECKEVSPVQLDIAARDDRPLHEREVLQHG